jgi:hypothetical protein
LDVFGCHDFCNITSAPGSASRPLRISDCPQSFSTLPAL